MLTSYPSLDPASAFTRPPSPACEDSHGPWDSPREDPLRWRRPGEHRHPRKQHHKEPKEEEAAPDSMEPRIEPEEDLRRLIANDLQLRLSGYYYGSLSWAAAARLLRRAAPGTFLLRDSEHDCFLYALSVQTPRGPTSCRIQYAGGRFRLDSARGLRHKMPRFESVPDLVEYYVRATGDLCRTGDEGGLAPVWLDAEDEQNRLGVTVQIRRPLYCAVRPLQHLCRVALVRADRDRTLDPRRSGMLPKVLRDYLDEYPYSQ